MNRFRVKCQTDKLCPPPPSIQTHWINIIESFAAARRHTSTGSILLIKRKIQNSWNKRWKKCVNNAKNTNKRSDRRTFRVSMPEHLVYLIWLPITLIWFAIAIFINTTTKLIKHSLKMYIMKKLLLLFHLLSRFSIK